MKRLIALLMLVVVIGSVYANVSPFRQLSRPLVVLPQASVYHVSGPLALTWLRFVAPGLVWAIGLPQGSLRVPPVNVPIPLPPVCGGGACNRLVPVQGIAQ